MSEHPINGMMGLSLDKIREMADANTIVGTPITAPDGTMLHTSLEDSCTDYAGAFAMLRTLPQPLPVLREEAVPARAASDIAFIKQFF